MRDGARGGHEAGGAPAPPGRAPHPRGPLGQRLALIPLPKNHIYSKINLRQFLSRLESI